MGLIYSSTDSQALLEGMRSNINAGKSVVQDLKNASHTITSSIGAGRALDGPAFNAGKDLFSALVIPTIGRADQAFDDMSNNLSRYESADGDVSGEGLLDEDQLKLQKSSYQTLKAGADATAATLRGAENLANSLAQPEIATVLGYFASQSEQFSDSLQTDIDEIEKKLKKLHTFNSAVNGLFNDDLNNFKIVVQAVSVLSDTVVKSDGSYQLPEGVDESWFSKIHKNSSEILGNATTRSMNELYSDLEKLLQSGQTDGVKRMQMLISAYPENVIKKLLKNDEFWTLANKLSDVAQTKLISGLAKYEELGRAISAGKFLPKINTLGKIADMIGGWTSPVKAGVKTFLNNSKWVKSLTADSKFFKVLGKAGSIATYASMGITFASSAADEFAKTGDVGKAAIGGTIDTIKSIGPLEGMTVGATIGSAIPVVGTGVGAAIGGAIGLINVGINWVNPHFYSDVKKGAYDLYDKGKATIGNVANDIGKGFSGAWNGVASLFGG